MMVRSLDLFWQQKFITYLSFSLKFPLKSLPTLGWYKFHIFLNVHHSYVKICLVTSLHKHISEICIIFATRSFAAQIIFVNCNSPVQINFREYFKYSEFEEQPLDGGSLGRTAQKHCKIICVFSLTTDLVKQNAQSRVNQC